jgi:hypothetical protein
MLSLIGCISHSVYLFNYYERRFNISKNFPNLIPAIAFEWLLLAVLEDCAVVTPAAIMMARYCMNL